MGAALAYFPFVKKARRLGRLVLQKAALEGVPPSATVLAYFGNDGAMTWPALTRLRLVVGPDMGLAILPLEAEVAPGAHVELTLQFQIPTDAAPGTLLRSG